MMQEIKITQLPGFRLGNAQDADAGTGASVGKFRGMEQAMKTGIGSYAVQLGALTVGRVVRVMRQVDEV